MSIFESVSLMYISSPPIAIETRAIGKPPLHIAGAVDLDVIDLGRDIASSVGRTRRLRSALAPIDVVHAGQTPQQLEAEFLELTRGEIAEVQGVHRRPSLRPAGLLDRRQVTPGLCPSVEVAWLVAGRERHVAFGEDAFDRVQPLGGYLLLEALKERGGRRGADRRDVLGQAVGV